MTFHSRLRRVVKGLAQFGRGGFVPSSSQLGIVPYPRRGELAERVSFSVPSCGLHWPDRHRSYGVRRSNSPLPGQSSPVALFDDRARGQSASYWATQRSTAGIYRLVTQVMCSVSMGGVRVVTSNVCAFCQVEESSSVGNWLVCPDCVGRRSPPMAICDSCVARGLAKTMGS